jgi:hypothetical protein
MAVDAATASWPSKAWLARARASAALQAGVSASAELLAAEEVRPDPEAAGIGLVPRKTTATTRPKSAVRATTSAAKARETWRLSLATWRWTKIIGLPGKLSKSWLDRGPPQAAFTVNGAKARDRVRRATPALGRALATRTAAGTIRAGGAFEGFSR